MSVPVRLLAGSAAGRRTAFVAVLTVLAGAYLTSPDGLGGIALFATGAVGLLALAVGPLVHRPANRRPWLWLTASGMLFLIGLLIRLEPVALPGPLGNADLWAF